MNKAITTTELYSYQKDAIKAILHEINIDTPLKIFLNLFMSAGKTIISLEIILRLLKLHPEEYAVIYVPPTTLNAWKLEVNKHYKYLVPKDMDNRSIFFIGSSSGVNKYLNENDVRGKVLIKTANSNLLDEICDEARYIVLDECHRLHAPYSAIINKCSNSSFLLLSGSECKLEYDMIYTMPHNEEKVEEKKYPELEYGFHVLTDGISYIDHISEDISNNEGHRTNIMIIDSAVDGEKVLSLRNTFGESFYDYSRKGSNNYKKYDANGGVLYTSIKLISEGNSFNSTSLMYIIYPEKSASTSISQCVRRMYRKSNTNDIVRIIFVMPKDSIDKIWIRCRLGVSSMMNWESKENDRIVAILAYLNKLEVSFHDLHDEEIALIFAYRLTPTSEIEDITFSFGNIKMRDMIKLMSI